MLKKYGVVALHTTRKCKFYNSSYEMSNRKYNKYIFHVMILRTFQELYNVRNDNITQMPARVVYYARQL